jgi:hypothetical protein
LYYEKSVDGKPSFLHPITSGLSTCNNGQQLFLLQASLIGMIANPRPKITENGCQTATPERWLTVAKAA